MITKETHKLARDYRTLDKNQQPYVNYLVYAIQELHAAKKAAPVKVAPSKIAVKNIDLDFSFSLWHSGASLCDYGYGNGGRKVTGLSVDEANDLTQKIYDCESKFMVDVRKNKNAQGNRSYCIYFTINYVDGNHYKGQMLQHKGEKNAILDWQADSLKYNLKSVKELREVCGTAKTAATEMRLKSFISKYFTLLKA